MCVHACASMYNDCNYGPKTDTIFMVCALLAIFIVYEYQLVTAPIHMPLENNAYS